MSTHLLFDEIFGQLQSTDRDRLEDQSNLDLQLLEVRRSLHRQVNLLLGDDDRGLEPPRGLCERTLGMIAMSKSKESRRLSSPRLEFSENRDRFRLADLLVAAAVLLIGLSALIPAIRAQQTRSKWLACQNNLRQIGFALNVYANQNHFYPLPNFENGSVGGMFALLDEQGLLNDPTILDCPAGGSVVSNQAPGLLGDSMEPPSTLNSDYAYQLGYQDDEGRLAPITFNCDDRFPMVADQPPYLIDPHTANVRVVSGNSPNHRGRGQNILFADSHVEWLRGRWLCNNDADIFLNEDRQTAPGRHRTDSVLAPASFQISYY